MAAPESVTFQFADESGNTEHELTRREGQSSGNLKCGACRVSIEGIWYEGDTYNLDRYCAIDLIQSISENRTVDSDFMDQIYSNFLEKSEYNKMTAELK